VFILEVPKCCACIAIGPSRVVCRVKVCDGVGTEVDVDACPMGVVDVDWDQE
jgi:hypothetical protein